MLARFGRSILLYYGCGRNTLANTARAGHTVLGFPPCTAPLWPHHRHPVVFLELWLRLPCPAVAPAPGRRTSCRPLRRHTDGYSGACVKRLSFYTVTTPERPTAQLHPSHTGYKHTPSAPLLSA